MQTLLELTDTFKKAIHKDTDYPIICAAFADAISSRKMQMMNYISLIGAITFSLPPADTIELYMRLIAREICFSTKPGVETKEIALRASHMLYEIIIAQIQYMQEREEANS